MAALITREKTVKSSTNDATIATTISYCLSIISRRGCTPHTVELISNNNNKIFSIF